MIKYKLALIMCNIYLFMPFSREKSKAEAKDRKVLEILQMKDGQIQEFEQVGVHDAFFFFHKKHTTVYV